MKDEKNGVVVQSQLFIVSMYTSDEIGSPKIWTISQDNIDFSFFFRGFHVDWGRVL